MMELKRSSSGQSKLRSINSIILKFPRFKEGLKEIKGVFEQFDEDSNGTIDRDELKKCVKKLQFHVKEEEIDDLFDSCDVDEKEGIQFNEFIVLLCLLYLVMDSSSSSNNTSKIGSPELEATFNTIVEAFLFLDKGGDGKLAQERRHQEEMDWDRSGNVSFRQFLFAFLDWVGIDTDDENHTTKR
ncbi:hypothetical protein P3L10_011109 [Capsicum annuum]